MNEVQIEKVKDILTKWNPLGERVNEISDLNEYEIEATDILWHIKSNSSIEQIERITRTVIEQAFNLHIKSSEVMPIAEQIHKVLTKK